VLLSELNVHRHRVYLRKNASIVFFKFVVCMYVCMYVYMYVCMYVCTGKFKSVMKMCSWTDFPIELEQSLAGPSCRY
jgi:hypothetical protein